MGDDLAGVGVGVGAQSIFHTAESGAYTGAVSASMVTGLGCQYVLCGHSERRTVFKDDDEAINKKVLKVIEDGMRPVLCIGETEEEYDAGLCADVCKLQLAKDLAGVAASDMKDVVIPTSPSGPSGRARSARATSPSWSTRRSATTSRSCTIAKRRTPCASSTGAP